MFKRKCHVCPEKEARIADLHEQLKHLRSLVIPFQQNIKIPALQLEADAALSGRDEMIEIRVTQEEEDEYNAIHAEADRVLSGNY